MSLNLDTLSRFRANLQSLLFFLLSIEATNTNFTVYGLNLTGLNPRYTTLNGDRANQKTTNAVL
jgi:hypothetical protein